MELLATFRSHGLGLLGERCGAHPRSLFTQPERETMEEKYLDLVLVPLSLLVSATYHSWLLLTILRHPKRTVIGLNALARQRWVRAMMAVFQRGYWWRKSWVDSIYRRHTQESNRVCSHYGEW